MSFRDQHRLPAHLHARDAAIGTRGDRYVNAAGTPHRDSLPTDHLRRGLALHESMFNQVAAEWPARAPRRGILGDAEPGSEHPAVSRDPRFGGLGREQVARRRDRRRMRSAVSGAPAYPGSRHRRRHGTPAAGRCTARRTRFLRSEGLCSQAPPHPRPPRARSHLRKRLAAGTPVMADPSTQTTSDRSFHCSSTRVGPTPKPKTNWSRPVAIRPVCASANVLPIVGWPAIGSSTPGVKIRMRTSVSAARRAG